MRRQTGLLVAAVAGVAWLWLALDFLGALVVVALRYDSWGLWAASALIWAGPPWMLWSWAKTTRDPSHQAMAFSADADKYRAEARRLDALARRHD